uniref:Uncharacterized protein n=1 Tax=Panagrolaimus sp. PS1159 TaxID=55785 RepID=A0AC35EWP3_9BILA
MRLSIFIVVVAFGISVVLSDECVCRKCQEMLAKKMQQINGDFLSTDQLVSVQDDAAGMYFNGQSLQEIAKFLKKEQNKYMTSSQINKVADITNRISNILGSTENTAKLIELAMNITLNFIVGDKAQVDQKIAEVKATSNDIGVAKQEMCRLIFTLYTPEKRQQLAKQVLEHISQDKRAQIRDILGEVFKVDDIDINNIGTASSNVF